MRCLFEVVSLGLACVGANCGGYHTTPFLRLIWSLLLEGLIHGQPGHLGFTAISWTSTIAVASGQTTLVFSLAIMGMCPGPHLPDLETSEIVWT